MPIALTLPRLNRAAKLAAVGTLVIAALLFSACTAVKAYPPASPLTSRPCDLLLPKGEVKDETIRCGYVTVPWDRTAPAGATAQLAYTVLKATGEHPRPDAIIHVAGGPGIGATLRQPVLEFIQRYAPLRADRDIILYDQRGMGNSVPFFQCPAPDAQQVVANRERLAAALGADPSEATVASATCQEELAAQGYSPSRISTATSAADLVDVMDALGYDAYHLYGISYGTRLLMALLHHFPEQPNVRSVVLDSPYPLPEDVVNDFAPIGYVARQALFEEVFALCAADPVCAAAFPRLRAQFDDLVQTLTAHPLTLPDGNEFTAEDLYRAVFPFNLAVNAVAYQPRLIAELAQGKTATLLQLRNGEVASSSAVTAIGKENPQAQKLVAAFLACEMDWSDEAAVAAQDAVLTGLWDAEPAAVQQFLAKYCLNGSGAAAAELIAHLPAGVFNSVIIRFIPDTIQGVNAALNGKLRCTEQFPFAASPAHLTAVLHEAGVAALLVDQALATMAAESPGCAGWSDALAAPTASTYGATPVLILSGQFDANTPPIYGELAAGQLPQAQLVIVPNAGHSILGNQGDCPTAMVKQFLATPGRPVDTTCTAEMHVRFLGP